MVGGLNKIKVVGALISLDYRADKQNQYCCITMSLVIGVETCHFPSRPYDMVSNEILQTRLKSMFTLSL